MAEKLDRAEYKRNNRRKHRKLDRELGIRYRSWEQIPGESFTDFKRRLTGKTIPTDKTYRAWERMPNETDKEFRKRLSSKRLPFR